MPEDLSDCVSLHKLPWTLLLARSKTIFNNNVALQIVCVTGVKDNKKHPLSYVLGNDLQYSL